MLGKKHMTTDSSQTSMYGSPTSKVIV